MTISQASLLCTHFPNFLTNSEPVSCKNHDGELQVLATALEGGSKGRCHRQFHGMCFTDVFQLTPREQSRRLTLHEYQAQNILRDVWILMVLK